MEQDFEKLRVHIVGLSESQNFDEARREWDLVSIEITEEFDHCPCGQQIKEHCYIINRLNGNSTYVGNICINRFIGIDTGALFDGLKRISKNISANANERVIEYAHRSGYLHENEYDFLMGTRLKRNLSERQLAWKQKINRRILGGIVVAKRTQR